MHKSLGIAHLPATVASSAALYLSTFFQRKNGLFKKAYELGVLCSVDVAVIIFGMLAVILSFLALIMCYFWAVFNYRRTSWASCQAIPILLW